VPRRQVLVALAAAPAGLAAACQGSPAGRPPSPGATATSPPPPDPLTNDLGAERRLLEKYEATIARHPSLTTRLAPLRDDHRAHLAALEQELGLAPATPTAAPSASGSATPAATATPGPAALAAVPGTPAAAVTALRAAEKTAAAARVLSCLTAPDDRAPLLASIGACEASHEVLLREQ
jgi:hypothetical protein